MRVNPFHYRINSINCNVEKKIQHLTVSLETPGSLIFSLEFHLLESLIQRRERFCYIDRQSLCACIFGTLGHVPLDFNFPNTFESNINYKSRFAKPI